MAITPLMSSCLGVRTSVPNWTAEHITERAAGSWGQNWGWGGLASLSGWSRPSAWPNSWAAVLIRSCLTFVSVVDHGPKGGFGRKIMSNSLGLATAAAPVPTVVKLVHVSPTAPPGSDDDQPTVFLPSRTLPRHTPGWSAVSPA